MSDPQHLGLGELGQRVQALGGAASGSGANIPAHPANANATNPTNPKQGPISGSGLNANPVTNGDPRLRPYQGAPLPIGSLVSRGPLPSFEAVEDPRSPQSPASQSAASPSAANAFSSQPPSQSPIVSAGPASASGYPFNSTPIRPFESVMTPGTPAVTAPPASSWENVSIPAQPLHSNASPNPLHPHETGASANTEPEGPAAAGSASASTGAASLSNSNSNAKTGFQRALDALRAAIPVVQKLLPLLDGNFATAVGALMAPQHHTPPPPVVVDMEPVERGLAEVRNSNRELRNQVVEQGASLKRVEDQLERVREATDRNTLEQQELVEDLRSVGNRISTLAVVGIVLLVLSLAANGYLLFQLQHILR